MAIKRTLAGLHEKWNDGDYAQKQYEQMCKYDEKQLNMNNLNLVIEMAAMNADAILRGDITYEEVIVDGKISIVFNMPDGNVMTY